MSRTNTFTSFFKMASVVYVAATLALLSFLFHLDSGGSFGSRISFLAGSLFATVINMRVASTELGSNEGLTLIDLIHITALILIIGATVLTIVADRQLDTGKKQSVRRFDFRNAMRSSAGRFSSARMPPSSCTRRFAAKRRLDPRIHYILCAFWDLCRHTWHESARIV